MKDKKKSIKQAFFSWEGLGVFDLIPVIRDFPYPIKFLLMIITVTCLLYFLNP